jgi:heme exporter protein D
VFPEADRYVAKTRKLHPIYVAFLSFAGTLRWLAATRTKEIDKKRALLEEACRQLRRPNRCHPNPAAGPTRSGLDAGGRRKIWEAG